MRKGHAKEKKISLIFLLASTVGYDSCQVTKVLFIFRYLGRKASLGPSWQRRCAPADAAPAKRRGLEEKPRAQHPPSPRGSFHLRLCIRVRITLQPNQQISAKWEDFELCFPPAQVEAAGNPVLEEKQSVELTCFFPKHWAAPGTCRKITKFRN